jgi:sulfur carrier protein
MTVVVNGVERAVPVAMTVAELVEWLGATPHGVAVAVNDEVVTRGAWATCALADGDRVEVVGAVQGG